MHTLNLYTHAQGVFDGFWNKKLRSVSFSSFKLVLKEKPVKLYDTNNYRIIIFVKGQTTPVYVVKNSKEALIIQNYGLFIGPLIWSIIDASTLHYCYFPLYISELMLQVSIIVGFLRFILFPVGEILNFNYLFIYKLGLLLPFLVPYTTLRLTSDAF